jgi:hypothetical protein
MRTEEAENRLRTLLTDAGVDVEHPSHADVARTWDVMERFAAEGVEDAAPRDRAGDAFLAQYGIFALSGQGSFELDMTRQFSFEDADGEYEHMSQLNCTFEFTPTDELSVIEPATLWSWDAEGDFFAEARTLPGFRIVEDLSLRPERLVISYSDV